MGRRGLEIGGPSKIFRQSGLIPIYGSCGGMDTCNFSDDTIWSRGEDRDAYGCEVTTRYVAEATDLAKIPDKTYDFLIASHVLEHVANPLKALEEWKRVLSPGGILLTILPDKRGTFDRRRPFTSIEHIEADYRRNISEDDLTHMAEVLTLHDLGLDPGAGRPEDFRARCLDNPSIRGMHHHVFSPEVLICMFARIQMRLLNVMIERPYHIIICAQRIVTESDEPGVAEQNLVFLNEDADWRLCDPLPRGRG